MADNIKPGRLKQKAYESPTLLPLPKYTNPTRVRPGPSIKPVPMPQVVKPHDEERELYEHSTDILRTLRGKGYRGR